jgi:hypothetical protein
MGCGRFACFYAPVLPLAGWTEPHADVGRVPAEYTRASLLSLDAGCKLGEYAALMIEYAQGLKLTHVDPTARFGVYVNGVAKLKPGFDRDAAVKTAAERRFPRDRATGVAFEDNGGIALAATLRPDAYDGGSARAGGHGDTSLSAEEITSGLKNLWHGLVAYHGAGLGHGDLHLSNVVRGPRGWRFIDFAPIPTDTSLFMQAQARDIEALQKMTIECVHFVKAGFRVPPPRVVLGDRTGSDAPPELKIIDSSFVFAFPKTGTYAKEALAFVDAHLGPRA